MGINREIIEEVAFANDMGVNNFILRTALTLTEEAKLKYIVGLVEENWKLAGITTAKELVESQILKDEYHQPEIDKIERDIRNIYKTFPENEREGLLVKRRKDLKYHENHQEKHKEEGRESTAKLEALWERLPGGMATAAKNQRLLIAKRPSVFGDVFGKKFCALDDYLAKIDNDKYMKTEDKAKQQDLLRRALFLLKKVRQKLATAAQTKSFDNYHTRMVSIERRKYYLADAENTLMLARVEGMQECITMWKPQKAESDVVNQFLVAVHTKSLTSLSNFKTHYAFLDGKTVSKHDFC